MGLVVVDLGSQRTAVFHLGSYKASNIIRQREKLITVWGPPGIISTNGGPPWNSQEWECWCSGQLIAPILHLPYHRQSNGVVKRKIQDLKPKLKNEQGDWKGWGNKLFAVLQGINSKKTAIYLKTKATP